MALSRTFAAGISLHALLGLPMATAAVADEFVVNGFSEAWQEHPDIATLKDGSFIVAWDTYFQGENGSYYFIIGQRLSPSGVKLGAEFVIDDDMNGLSRHPTLAALPSGGFAVVWENSLGSVLDDTDVYTRVFTAGGEPVSASTRVHAADRESQYSADVTASRNGYLITYTSYEGPQVPRQDEVLLQRVDAKGQPRGAPVKINQASELDQKAARLATLSNGNVVAIWDSESGGSFGDGIADELRGRIFNPFGKPVTPEFVVSADNSGLNTAVNATDTSAAVAALPGGRFVASWTETVLDGAGDDTTYEVHGRIFDGRGRAAGAEFVVRESTEGVPRHSNVAALRSGGFVVSWDAPGSRSFAFQDAYARAYDRNGRPAGREFYLNQAWSRSDQELPTLAVTKGDRILAIYESEFLDGDDDGIAGRAFRMRGRKMVPAASRPSAEAASGARRASGTAAPRGLDRLIARRTDGLRGAARRSGPATR